MNIQSIKTYPFLLIFLCIFIVVFVPAHADSIKKRLMNMYLWRVPAANTELYFKDHKNLPITIPENGVVKFSFIINNKELERMGYSYKVTSYSDITKSTQILDEGRLSLENQDMAEIPVNISITPTLQRTKVSVVLLEKNQEISFWLGESQ